VFVLNKITYLIGFLISINSFSQEIDKGEAGLLLTKEYIVGLNFNTLGWGAAFDLGRQKNFKYKNTFGFVLTNIRHQKEYKLIGTSGTKGYYFGKINSVVALRLTYGGNLKIFKSVRENGIEIQYKWRIGPSFGLVKPVYLEIDKSINSGFLAHFPERYNPEIHFPGIIYSRSSWVEGIKESNVQLGVYVKTGLDFNFSTFKTGISGGEIGFMVDYYPLNNIEILYQQKGLNLFASLYLQFNLGKKF
jgi:hypothetical protein